MTSTFLWLAFSIVLAIVELATYGLVTIWFSIGALVAFILSLCGVPVIWQTVVFVVVSALLLIFTKPILQKKLAIKREATNADRVIGQKAIVLDSPESEHSLFRVRVLQQVWSAQMEDNSLVTADEEVIVTKIQGVKLIVKKLEN